LASSRRIAIVTIITVLLFVVPLAFIYAVDNSLIVFSEDVAVEYGFPIILTIVVAMFFLAYDLGLIVQSVRNKPKPECSATER